MDEEVETPRNNTTSLTLWGIYISVGVLILLSIIFIFVYPEYLKRRTV